MPEYQVQWNNGVMELVDGDSIPQNNPNAHNSILGQLPMPNQHIEWLLILGTVAFLALYAMKKNDYALFVFGVLIGGTFADLYIHGYQH